VVRILRLAPSASVGETAGVDPKRAFKIGLLDGENSEKAVVGATDRMRQDRPFAPCQVPQRSIVSCFTGAATSAIMAAR
jgi:hypothetical protein